MLSTIVNTNAWSTFGVSAWILPVVVLCYAVGESKPLPLNDNMLIYVSTGDCTRIPKER